MLIENTRVKVWYSENVDIDDGPVTMTEQQMIKRFPRLGKGTYLYEIPPKVLKRLRVQ